MESVTIKKVTDMDLVETIKSAGHYPQSGHGSVKVTFQDHNLTLITKEETIRPQK